MGSEMYQLVQSNGRKRNENFPRHKKKEIEKDALIYNALMHTYNREHVLRKS